MWTFYRLFDEIRVNVARVQYDECHKHNEFMYDTTAIWIAFNVFKCLLSKRVPVYVKNDYEGIFFWYILMAIKNLLSDKWFIIL